RRPHPTAAPMASFARWEPADAATPSRLQPRIDVLPLEREHAEGVLVHPPERLVVHEAFEALDAQREHPQRERSLHVLEPGAVPTLKRRSANFLALPRR